MANRIELNDELMDNVVGGAFTYNSEDDGSMTCRVDGAGTYNCSESAKRKISLFIMNNDGCTLQDVIDYALSTGVFW